MENEDGPCPAEGGAGRTRGHTFWPGCALETRVITAPPPAHYQASRLPDPFPTFSHLICQQPFKAHTITVAFELENQSHL